MRKAVTVDFKELEHRQELADTRAKPAYVSGFSYAKTAGTLL